MGWYFRKSIKMGLGRINFSGSGISYSFGIKGARVNTGTRGTYVNFGYNGIYYRKKLSSTAPSTPRNLTPIEEPVESLIHTITSGDIDQLTDTDSKEFIEELSEKAKKLSYFRWFGIFPSILFLIFFFSYFSQPIKSDESKKYIIVIDSAANANVRQRPDKKSTVLGRVFRSQIYEVVDTTQKAWNKIKYGDTVGYVSKQFSHIDSISATVETYSRFETSPKEFYSTFLIGMVFFIFICYTFFQQDKGRLLVEIHYEIDEKLKEVYDKFIYHFKEVSESKKVWQYLHAKNTYDYKHHAGAGQLVDRISVKGISPDKKPANLFRTNIQVPNITLRNTDLYFFPERLIVKRGNEFAAVFYKNLDIQSQLSRFIEDGGVPSDAKVVDYTWKYVNKNGSPDRRFNNNRKLPICLYSQYLISSETGVFEVISTSKEGAFDNFAHFIKTIGIFQKKYAE